MEKGENFLNSMSQKYSTEMKSSTYNNARRLKRSTSHNQEPLNRSNRNMILQKRDLSSNTKTKMTQNFQAQEKSQSNHLKASHSFLKNPMKTEEQLISPKVKNLQQYKLRKVIQSKKLELKDTANDKTSFHQPKSRLQSPKTIRIRTPSAHKLRINHSCSPNTVAKYESRSGFKTIQDRKNSERSTKLQKTYSDHKKQGQKVNKIYTTQQIYHLQKDMYSDMQIQISDNVEMLPVSKRTKLLSEVSTTKNKTNNGACFYKIPKIGYELKPFKAQSPKVRPQSVTVHQKRQNPKLASKHKKKPIYEVSIRDFDLLRKLGKGQNGQIYSAIHKKTGMVVALKHFQQKKVVIDYLIDEMKIQLFCKHDNILPAFGYIIEKSSSAKGYPKEQTGSNPMAYDIFIIMQKGESNLFKLIRDRHRLSEDDTAIFARQILKGLSHLHDHDIMHRDIKPENIILVNGVCKITDFGWSIITTEQRETFCGTLQYVSPQVAKGRKYDQKIDTWSVGILIYEMLTGEAPFDSDNILKKPTEEYRKRILNRLPMNTSDQCKQLIALLLRINPNTRISIKEALQHSWIRDAESRKTLRKDILMLEEQFSKILYRNLSQNVSP